MTFPVSIEGVLLPKQDSVVLLMNERNEWELPGGRIEVGETPETCLAREFAEELAVTVMVGPLLDSYLFEVKPEKYVFIVTYGCMLTAAFAPTISDEHKELGVFPVSALPVNLPPGYRNSILSWHHQQRAG